MRGGLGFYQGRAQGQAGLPQRDGECCRWGGEGGQDGTDGGRGQAERGRGGKLLCKERDRQAHYCSAVAALTLVPSPFHRCCTVPQERQAFLEPYKHYKQFRDAGGQLCLEEFADAREVGSVEFSVGNVWTRGASCAWRSLQMRERWEVMKCQERSDTGDQLGLAICPVT